MYFELFFRNSLLDLRDEYYYVLNFSGISISVLQINVYLIKLDAV